jgi:hypothetical protein
MWTSKRGSLTVEDHLDGEGPACGIAVEKLKLHLTKKGTRDVVSIMGNAICQAEENPRTKDTIYLLYSRGSSADARAEILVFANASEGGATEILRRK